MMSTLSRSAIVLIALLAGCGTDRPAAPATRVHAVVTAARADMVPETRVLAGTIRAANVSTLSARVVGNVTRVLVSENDRVHAGQILIEIDDRDARAQSDAARAGRDAAGRALESATAAVDAATANAQLAEATFRRFGALRERGSVSPQEFEEVQARKQIAAAELDRARRTREQLLAQRAAATAGASGAATLLDFTRVRAPFDGIVTARLVDPGAQAAPGVPLLIVESADRFRVETMIDETLRVRPGDAVTVDLDGRRVAARVAQVVTAVDPRTRSSLVKIDLPAADDVRSGSYVRVAFATGMRRAVTVPASAIVRQGQLTSVFTPTGGLARLRLVTLGEPFGERVEILSGLVPGEPVVAPVVPAVRDGVQIDRGDA